VFTEEKRLKGSCSEDIKAFSVSRRWVTPAWWPIVGAAAGASLSIVSGYLVVGELRFLILIPIAILGVWALIQPHVGLYILMASFGFEHMVLVGGAATVTRLVGMAVFGIWVLNKLAGRRAFESIYPARRALLSVALFVVWAIISGLWAIDRVAWFGTVQSYINLLMATILVSDLVQNKQEIQKCLVWICLSALIIVIVPLFQTILSGTLIPDLYLRHFRFGIANVNQYGAFLTALVPICLMQAKLGNRISQYSWMLAGVVLTVGVVFSVSRASLIGLTAAIAVHFALSRGSIRGAGYMLIVGLGVTFMIQHPLLTDRFAAIVEGYRENVRSAIWHQAQMVFAQNPLLGIGAGNFSQAVTTSWMGNTRAISAHNLVVSLAVELGLVGTLLFGVVVWQCIRALRKVIGDRGVEPYALELARSLLSSLAGLFVYGMMHDIDSLKILWLVLILSFTLANVHSKTQ
jgi:O-antigen ligase